MTVSDILDYLEENFPDINFYNGTIDKNSKCVSVYQRERGKSYMALGGSECTSFNYKPLTILIHWTKDASLCEGTANLIYNFLFGKSDFYINGRRIVSIDMLDSGPIDLKRDENGICEMVIRTNIIYDREVKR